MYTAFVEAFDGFRVTVDDPFAGGYITRHHARHGAWLQLELSRAPFLPVAEKRARVLAAITAWCATR